MTNFGRKMAYQNVRNYICSQIAYTKENLSWYSDEEVSDYADDRKEELIAYKKILNILTDNQSKIRED